MKIFRYSILSAFALFIFSCGQTTTETGLSQGIIEYEVTYPDTREEIPYKDFMPNTMLFKFKDNKIAFEMSGPMNLVKTSFISNLENKDVLHLFKLMDKKFATVYSGEDVAGIEEIQNIKINHTGKTKEIAGYTCEQALITFIDDENTSFEIYYTDQLKLNSPNWSTPYKSIDGVLMQYRLKRYNLTMDFTAKKVRKAELTEKDFQKPADYKLIPKDEVIDLLRNPF